MQRRVEPAGTDGPSDRACITLVTPAGAVLSHERKDSPVKARLAFLAVVLGALMLALVMADGTPWP
jgi:hypothetical protein